MALPSGVGLILFWIGSAFDNVSLPNKTSIAALGYALAYMGAALSTNFFYLLLSAMVFAMAGVFSLDVVGMLLICFRLEMTKYQMASYFCSTAGYFSHALALNPLVTHYSSPSTLLALNPLVPPPRPLHTSATPSSSTLLLTTDSP